MGVIDGLGKGFRSCSVGCLADDRIVWVDRSSGVEALYVAPDGPGAKAGIHPGDHLERIDGTEIRRSLDVPQMLVRIGSWSSGASSTTGYASGWRRG